MQEIWKPIAGYESIYEISSLGRIRSVDRMVRCMNRSGTWFMKSSTGKVKKQNKTNSGYLDISLHGKHFQIHRLVAQAFIENTLGLPCVNHIDGDKLNNAASNLEWCTHKHNIQHAVSSGLLVAAKGERSGQSKLAAAQVREIRSLLCEGVSQRKIAALFGVSQRAIGAINLGRSWGHLK